MAQEIEARNLQDDARETLHEVIGEDPGAIAKLREPIPLLSPEPADSAAWGDQALVQNLRVAAASAAVDTAREEIDRQGPAISRRSTSWGAIALTRPAAGSAT